MTRFLIYATYLFAYVLAVAVQRSQRFKLSHAAAMLIFWIFIEWSLRR